MISDALLDVLFWLIRSFMDLLGSLIPAPPTWVADGLNFIPTIYGFMEDFDAWIPVNFALGAVGWIIVVNGIVIGLKLLRMFISYSTFGGGATST